MAENSLDIRKDISSLQQDMAKVNVISSRIDTTLEKLTEVSSSVAKLLAVHENRIDQQEKVSAHLSDLIEKRKDEYDKMIGNIYSRINETEKELYREIESTTDKVVKELKQMREEQNNQHVEMNKRINKIEKWIWIVSGGSIAIGFIISEGISLLKLLFNF